MPLAIAVLMVLVASGITGCAQTGYYLQSIGGHLDLLSRREPIDELVSDPQTPEPLRERLATLLEIRQFASSELGLPENSSYHTYVDLGRPYVVWSVFAAPEFSLDPVTWCFPFIGCVAYRGYFSEARARSFAEQLAGEGLDVHVAGVAAYTTLGFTSDPVLSTMLVGDDSYLAGVIFHELAHRQLYIQDDSAFNESFASLVEEEGVRRWLTARGDASAWEAWLARRERRRQFDALVAMGIQDLRALYRSDLAPEQMRQGKTEIANGMRDDYQALRAAWGGVSAYESWFRGTLNNAQLSAVATYREWVPAFRALLDRSDGDLARLYRRAAEIGAMPAEARRQVLEGLLEEASLRDSDAQAG